MDNWNNMYMPGDKGNNNLQGKTNTVSPLNNNSVNRPLDNTTEFGKGTKYYTCDGKEVATMEQVFSYNQMYYDSMLKEDSEEKGMHR